MCGQPLRFVTFTPIGQNTFDRTHRCPLYSASHRTPLQKESQVRFEMPEKIPLGHEYMMQMLPENQKIKNF